MRTLKSASLSWNTKGNLTVIYKLRSINEFPNFTYLTWVSNSHLGIHVVNSCAIILEMLS